MVIVLLTEERPEPEMATRLALLVPDLPLWNSEEDLAEARRKWRQGWRCWSWICPYGIQRRIWPRHYYWYLTNEGIGYLRNYLHLPPEIVPTTLKRQSRPDARPRPSAGGAGGRSFGDKPADGDRAAYRRAPGAGNGDKAGAAGPGSAPMEFRGGFGRGKTE